MIIDGPQPVTQAVLQAMAQGDAPRLREVMSAFVQHRHDLVREVRLTESEWVRGVEFLDRIGQATHNQHNESILFSGAIGVSSLVCLLNNDAPERAAALLARARAPSVRVLAVAPGVAATEFVPGRSEVFISCAAVLDRDGRPLRGPALAGDAAVCTRGGC